MFCFLCLVQTDFSIVMCCVTQFFLASLCQPGDKLYHTSVLWLLQMHRYLYLADSWMLCTCWYQMRTTEHVLAMTFIKLKTAENRVAVLLWWTTCTYTVHFKECLNSILTTTYDQHKAESKVLANTMICSIFCLFIGLNFNISTQFMQSVVFTDTKSKHLASHRSFRNQDCCWILSNVLTKYVSLTTETQTAYTTRYLERGISVQTITMHSIWIGCLILK